MSDPSFAASMVPALEEAGLAGDAAVVTFDGGRLFVRGETSGVLTWTLGMITAMRVHVALGRHDLYAHALNLVVGGKEVELRPRRPNQNGDYGRLARALGSALIARRVPVVTGQTWLVPLALMVTMGVAFTVITVATFSVQRAEDPADEDYVLPLTLLGVEAIVAIIIGVLLWRRVIPRPARMPADLERGFAGC